MKSKPARMPAIPNGKNVQKTVWQISIELLYDLTLYVQPFHPPIHIDSRKQSRNIIVVAAANLLCMAGVKKSL
jgi:hypothetical protein